MNERARPASGAAAPDAASGTGSAITRAGRALLRFALWAIAAGLLALALLLWAADCSLHALGVP